MDDQIKKLEDRLTALEADKLAVIMSVNSDANLFRSWQRTAMGRVNIGIGTSNPSTSAILDLSSTSLAFRPPVMTTTQRDAIPVNSSSAGFVIYNTTTGVLNFYNGTVWGAV